MTSTVTPRMGALLLAWALGVYGVLGGLPQQSAHELHLELSRHALGSFTSLWSTHWDLGHSFAGHPPLFHQLVALLARVPLVGLEMAYAGVMACLPVALTAAMGLFVERLNSRRAGDVAAWLTAANPLVVLFLFPFGQGPFLLGTGLALVAGACWVSPAVVRPSVERRGHVAGALFAVAAVCAHAAALVPLCVVGTLAITQPKVSSRWRLGLVASAVTGGVLAAFALAPFLEVVRTGGLVTVPSKLFTARALSTGIIWGLITWSAVVGAGLGGRSGRWLSVLLVALTAMSALHLSVGIASDKWLWFAAVFAPVAWALMGSQGQPLASQSVLVRALVAAVFISLSLSSYFLGGRDNDQYGHRNTALREARLVLEQPGSELFRYLTLRVGAARFELARRVRAPSADSGLPWVASSALRGTEFVNIDELPLGQPRGLAALDVVLAQAESLHVRWVLCGDSRATKTLQKAGFELRSAWKGDLTLWERPSVLPLAAPTTPAHSSSWAWAIIPLSSLAVGVSLRPWRRRYRAFFFSSGSCF